MGKKAPVEINGIWLRKIGSEVQVLVNMGGRWRVVIQEQADSEFSHIVEPGGIARGKLERIR